MRSELFNEEPSWQKSRSGTRQTLPDSIQSWVYESGSLTERLRKQYGLGVRVTVLSQTWCVPFLSEAKLLKVKAGQVCLVREVLLHIDDQALILARTVIPRATLKLSHHLTHLGTRPLGEVLFAYPQLKRVTMEVTQIPLVNWTMRMQKLTHIQQTIWGRRTIYEIKHRQMLVSEFFLPTITTDD